MEEHNCKNIIFSSSATVYGDPHTVPILEDFPLSVTNPYGRTKLMLEEILTDIYKADSEWNVVLLRYFNQSEPMRVVIWEKIQTVFQIISCHM